MLETEVNAAISLISDEAQSVLEAIGDSYNTYSSSKSLISEWYSDTFNTSEQLYQYLISCSIDCYKQIGDKCVADNNYDWDSVLDEVYDAWNDAMDSYYDSWNDLHDEIYDKWNNALEDKSIDYSVVSDAWSVAFDEHSSSWSALFDAHSDAWSVLFDYHSEIWNGFFSDNYDVDSLIQKAKEEREKREAEQDNNESEETIKETEASENVAVETKESNSVFNPQDVSDETIESIQTYGDYLKMYRLIIDNYYANYENVIKGTILYSEESFQQIKEEMNSAFEKQEKDYDSLKETIIIGKNTLVDFLKNYRDSLQQYVDSIAKSLG